MNLKKMPYFFNMKLFANNCHVEVINSFSWNPWNSINNGNGK